MQPYIRQAHSIRVIACPDKVIIKNYAKDTANKKCAFSSELNLTDALKINKNISQGIQYIRKSDKTRQASWLLKVAAVLLACTAVYLETIYPDKNQIFSFFMAVLAIFPILLIPLCFTKNNRLFTYFEKYVEKIITPKTLCFFISIVSLGCITERII